MSLSKLGDPQMVKPAVDEIKELMTEHITNTDRMNAFLTMAAEVNEHMKPNQKKEQIKLYGVAAEIFEESLIPFMPKILTYIQRKLKENDNQLHVVISDSLGQLVHHVLKKVDSIDDMVKEFNPILKMIFSNLMLPSKTAQIGCAMSLTRVIQNAPVLVLQSTLSYNCQKIIEVLQSQQCKCQTQLLETIISLVLAVEMDFGPYAAQFLPFLLECMTLDDWTTRKMAIDVIYTMAAILKDALSPYKKDILEVLDHSRSDKIKPVREATIEAIQAVKGITDQESDIEEHQTNRDTNNQSETSYKRQRDSDVNTHSINLKNNKNIKQVKQAQTGPQRTSIHQNSGRNQPNSKIVSLLSEESKAEFDQANKRAPLSLATQKKMQRSQVINNDQRDSRREQIPKQSIFNGPKNNSFFKLAQESSDIEVHALERDPNQFTSVDNSLEDNTPIQIYEGKKVDSYQDFGNEITHQRSEKKNHFTQQSNKKSSPIKKHFHEQIELGSSCAENNPLQNDYLEKDEKSDEKSYQSQNNSQARYQQPKQTWSKPTNMSTVQGLQPQSFQQYQPAHLFMQPSQQSDMSNLFNPPPQYSSQFHISASSFPPEVQPNLFPPTNQSSDQQIAFLIQEIQRMQKTQTQILDRMNQYQDQTKADMFQFQARLARIEDIMAPQLQQHKGGSRQSYVNQQPQMHNSHIYPHAQQQQQYNNFMNPGQTRQKWGGHQQNPTSLWHQITEKLNKHQLNDAYKLVLNDSYNNQSDTEDGSNLQEDRDLLLIKLVGKTGVCLSQLEDKVIDTLLNRIIRILSQREFIEVLLPWLSSITNYLSEQSKDKSLSQINLDSLSSLVECLILLIKDESGGLSESQRSEVQNIYQTIQSNFQI